MILPIALFLAPLLKEYILVGEKDLLRGDVFQLNDIKRNFI